MELEKAVKKDPWSVNGVGLTENDYHTKKGEGSRIRK